MIIEIILLIISLVSVFGYVTLLGLIKDKYIKVDIILYNAINEAIEYAKLNKNEFERKKYTELLDEIRGKINI